MVNFTQSKFLISAIVSPLESLIITDSSLVNRKHKKEKEYSSLFIQSSAVRGVGVTPQM